MDSPFQLMHTDIAKWEFLDKSAAMPKYALLLVGLYASKVYVYPIRSRKQLSKYMNEYYVEINKKRKKVGNLPGHTDNEFQQTKMKVLNDKYNVTMFTNVQGEKAFVAEQKIKENLKSEYKKSRQFLFKQKQRYHRQQ